MCDLIFTAVNIRITILDKMAYFLGSLTFEIK
jgi:hypothetical protein